MVQSFDNFMTQALSSREHLSRIDLEALQSCLFFDNNNFTVDRNRLGGKGASLFEMTRLGLPVPLGFTIPTETWQEYQKANHTLQPSVWNEIKRCLELLEQKTRKTLGDPKNPLFVSVRSGAAVSMPGMLDTKINLGINSDSLPFLEKLIGQEAAHKIYGSFQDFPEDPLEQIRLAIENAFNSWNTPKAQAYRERHGIGEIGTAVTIQEMVWGNSLREEAGTGVLLTRDTQKYSHEPVVTFAPHAQGPAVVSAQSFYGQVPLSQFDIPSAIRNQLSQYATLLENYYQLIPQDIEFTYDGSKLWILQTRDVPLSPLANLRSQQDRIEKKAITLRQAMAQMPSAHLNALIKPSLDTTAMERAEQNGQLLGEGLSVSIGTRSGRVVTSLAKAKNINHAEPIILADPELDSFTQLPFNVKAVLLEKAGIGSHLAREGTQLSSERNVIVVFGVRIDPLYEDQTVTVDGNTGKVFEGAIALDTSNTQVSLIPPMERKIAKDWLQAKRENPWQFVADTPDPGNFGHQIKEALGEAEANEIRSLKAREITAFNAAIPAEIRQTYTVIKADDSAENLAQKIRPILEKIFAGGNHATIRTCHSPALPANGPWARVQSMADFEQFLTDEHYSEKYGGFQTFLANPQLTELLVGDIPVGKMESEPKIQYQHCTWTLSCTENDLVVLQVNPHSPHLREHEKAEREDLITYTTRFDPKSPNSLALIHREIGANRLQDEQAISLGEIARQHIFDKWWTAQQLPQRMAALTQELGVNATFEGQATKAWCLGYGIKTR